MPAGLGRLQQGGGLGRGQEVLGPFMPVRSAGCVMPWPTLYISLPGRTRRNGRDPLLLLAAA